MMYKEDWQRIAKECEEQIENSRKSIEINEVMRDTAKSMIDKAKAKPCLTKELSQEELSKVKTYTG